jgi:light-regulated signal transduction histidine kinase (bacteriophytochrome)
LLDTILYWLLFNLVMFYILEVIEKYLKKLNSSYMLIEQQRNELKALNHDLEHQVRQRTSSLENQNKKLRGYAYYNAHLLRGPFCRIQGLVNLLNTIENTEEKDGEIMPRLSENIHELESVISKIQLIVNTETEEMDLPDGH